VRALIGIDPYLMAAAIVRATDQEAANASGAHLCEGDLLLARGLGHAPSFRRSRIKGIVRKQLQGRAILYRSCLISNAGRRICVRDQGSGRPGRPDFNNDGGC
jgi:hypothetical protein